MTTVEVIEQVVSVVEVTETEIVLQTVESVQVVELGISGPQGATGVTGSTGPTGPQGEPGTPGSAPQAYEHVQGVASDTWTVAHGLGYRPNVHIQDSLGRDVTAEVVHTDLNTMVLSFSALLTGSASLS